MRVLGGRGDRRGGGGHKPETAPGSREWVLPSDPWRAHGSPEFPTLGFQNYERIHFCCLSRPAGGSLLTAAPGTGTGSLRLGFFSCDVRRATVYRATLTTRTAAPPCPILTSLQASAPQRMLRDPLKSRERAPSCRLPAGRDVGGAALRGPIPWPSRPRVCTCPRGDFIARREATHGALGDGPDQKEMEQERGPTTYSLGPVEMSPCVGHAHLIKLRIWAWTEDGTTTFLMRDAGKEGDLTTDRGQRRGQGPSFCR